MTHRTQITALLTVTVCYKGYNSEQPDGRDAQGSVWGKGSRASMSPLSRCTTLLSVFSEALWTPSFRGFMEVSLHSHDWLNHGYWWFDSISSPSSLPGGLYVGVKTPTLLITWLVPLATSPHPGVIEGPTLSPLISVNSGMVERGLLDAPIIPVTQEILRILEVLHQEPGTKTKYVFFTVSQCLTETLTQEHSKTGPRSFIALLLIITPQILPVSNDNEMFSW